MLIDDLRLEDAPAGVLLSARVQLDNGSFSGRIEYRYLGLTSGLLTTRGDAFLVAMLVPAMRASEDVVIESPVSPLLLSRVERAIELLAEWGPNLEPIKVLASPAYDAAPQGDAIGLFFSSGVDSFYSLLKNLDEHPRGPEAITHLIYVMDYGLPRPFPPHVKKSIVAQTRRIADETGKQLLLIQTNIRQGPGAGWRMHHGSALISHVLPLQPLLRKCLIASGMPNAVVIPWGTHPDLDPLFSTEGVEIMRDGGEAYRTEKMTKYVGRSQLALDTLRLCSSEEHQPKNCGQCRKCVQAMIVLHSLGVLDRSSAFVRPLQLRHVWLMPVEEKRYAAKQHLSVLRGTKGNGLLVLGLRFAILRHDIRRFARFVLRPFRGLLGLPQVGRVWSSGPSRPRSQ